MAHIRGSQIMNAILSQLLKIIGKLIKTIITFIEIQHTIIVEFQAHRFEQKVLDFRGHAFTQTYRSLGAEDAAVVEVAHRFFFIDDFQKSVGCKTTLEIARVSDPFKERLAQSGFPQYEAEGQQIIRHEARIIPGSRND